MTHTVHHINIDCLQPVRLSQFWQHVTGMSLAPDEDLDPHEVLLFDPAQRCPNLLFTRVPESRLGKNRVHLDVQPTHTTRDRSVEELVAMGATVLNDCRQSEGGGWVVMADPEGNEFCVERSVVERGIDPWLASAPRDLGDRRYADERAEPDVMLIEMLDWYRVGVEHKVRAMSDSAVRRRLGRSETSVIGLVNHLALVEDAWFTERFAGGEPMPAFAGVDWDADPDYEFRTALDESLDVVLGRYVEACARSRAIAASHPLDQLAASQDRRFTLRWALLHLIEETARHLGHIDVIAELTDGVTGE